MKMSWVLLLAVQGVLCSATAPQQVPFRMSDPDIARKAPEIRNHTGVGFDFAPNYVSAAVSLPNGTKLAIATLPGSKKYVDLMYRMTLESSEHLSPPHYQNPRNALRDLPRQLKRRFLRSIGLPSCYESAVMGSMLRSLKKIVEERLGYGITHGMASFPQYRALYAEDIWDAFEYAGLIFQEIQNPFLRPSSVWDFAANYASQGYYLCRDFKNKTACEIEQERLDGYASGYENTLNFHLSDTVFMLTIPMMSSPYVDILTFNNWFYDYELGLSAMARRGKEAYWNAVETRIETLLEYMDSGPIYLTVEKVFVTGAGAEQSRFRNIVRKVSQDRGIDVQFFMDEATTLTATGTAELSMRGRYLHPHQPHPSVHLG